MTTTLELLDYTKQPEKYESAETTAESVQDILNKIVDESSELHQIVYGENGIVPSALEEVRRPAAGHRMLLKNETSHAVTFPDGTSMTVEAFKRRGALVATYCALSNNPYLQAVSTASAGNHGLGVAAAAKQFGLDAHIHTASNVSEVKEEKILSLGANVYKPHQTFPDALNAAELHAQQKPETAYIHAYNSVETIAGQATIGLEVVSDLLSKQLAGEIDLHKDKVHVVLPVGGGGLAAGVAIVVKHARDQGLFGDNVEVVSVEVENKQHNRWSDGTATETGDLPKLVLEDPQYVQQHRTVDVYELADAMHTLTGVYHKRIEPAGAIAYAGATQIARTHPVPEGHERTTFVVPVTGANVTRENYEYAEALRHERYQSRVSKLSALAITKTTTSPVDTVRNRRIHIADGYHV